MRDLIIKIMTEESKRLIKESGIRDINKLAKRYQMAKIYFHQDLDPMMRYQMLYCYYQYYYVMLHTPMLY